MCLLNILVEILVVERNLGSVPIKDMQTPHIQLTPILYSTLPIIHKNRIKTEGRGGRGGSAYP